MAEEVVGIVARVLGFLARLLFEFLFSTFFYTTGRIGLPILTFGWWRVVPLTDWKSDTGIAFKRQPDGTLLFDTDMGVILGILIWILIGFLIFVALQLRSLL